MGARNFLTAYFRVIMRKSFFTLINILGLALGLAFALLIFFWIIDELQYDRFHSNRDRIYRVNTVFEQNPEVYWTNSPFPLGSALVSTYPFINEYTRIWEFPAMLEYESVSHFESGGMLVDPGFFQMFSYPVIKGSIPDFSKDKQSVLITESLSTMLFGQDDPIGKVIKVKDEYLLIVSGVLSNPPRKSQQQFSFLASVELLPSGRLTSGSFDVPLYIMRDTRVTIENAQSQLKDFYKNLDSNSTAEIVLQPYLDIHLNETVSSGISKSLRLFGAVAVMLIIIACINYMNLGIIRLIDRSREVALRKIAGASSKIIRRQFLMETSLTTVIALFIAIVLVELLITPFNNLTGRSLQIDYGDFIIWLVLIAVFIVTVGLSGIYPAFISAKFNPIEILYNRFRLGKGNLNLRTLLVIIQFTISTILIIAAITVNRQMRFIYNSDLGYEMENRLTVNMGFDSPLIGNYDALKQLLLNNPSITSVSASSLLPTNVNWQVRLDWEENETGELLPVRYLMVDYDFIETMGMDLSTGRSFSKKQPSDDSISYMVNEAAIKAMGISEPIDHTIYFAHQDFPERLRRGKIIGVVKDFHSGSFYRSVTPLVMRVYKPWFSYIILRISPINMSETVQYVKDVFEEMATGYPFEFLFFEDAWRGLYHEENQMNKLIQIFALLAIIISILGMIGLSSYSIQKRIKEVGIRKINGASSEGVYYFLIVKNIKYVFISIAIATPIGGFLMRKWLIEYAYKIDLSVWIFIAAAIITLIISLLTLIILVTKLANQSPLKHLGNE